MAVGESEAHREHSLLTGSEGLEHMGKLLLEQGRRSGVCRGGSVVIGDEVAEMAVLLLADGGLKGDGLLSHAHYLAHLVNGHIEYLGDFLRRGVSAVLVQQLAVGLFDLVYGLDHVNGDSYRPRLIGYGAGYRLPYPPCGVGREFESLCVIELVNSLDKSEVALLNKIEELHASADIALCDADDESEVRLGQSALCGGVVVADSDGELDLLLGGEQRNLAYLLEIDLDGVVDSDVLVISDPCGVSGRLGRLAQIEVDIIHIQHRQVVDYLDILRLDRLIELIKILDIKIHVDYYRVDLLGGQFACGFTLFDKGFHRRSFFDTIHYFSVSFSLCCILSRSFMS